MHAIKDMSGANMGEGTTLPQRWRRRESNPGPQGIPSTLIHVRSRITQATGLLDSASTYPLGILTLPSQGPPGRASLSADALPLPRRSHGWTVTDCFLGSHYECVVVRNYNVPGLFWAGSQCTQVDLQSPRRNRSPPLGVSRMPP